MHALTALDRYISAGNWPDSSVPRSPKRRFELQNENGKFSAEYNSDMRSDGANDDGGAGYEAQLVGTTDGGQVT